MLRYRALESNNLEYEGEDFLASCAARMGQFSVPADYLVERVESKMLELSNSKVGAVSAVSGRHIEAVRQQLVKKRKQEVQFGPTADGFLEILREDKKVRTNQANREYLAQRQEAQRQESQRQEEAERQRQEGQPQEDAQPQRQEAAQRQRQLFSQHHYKLRHRRLRREKIGFEENCRSCTYPSIKSAVWVGLPPPDSNEELTSEVQVTFVVEVGSGWV
jgi:hypothetical protein